MTGETAAMTGETAAASRGLPATGPERPGRADRGGGTGARSRAGIRLAAGIALTLLLFAGYLRLSWTVAATADGAAEALQARAMLAGNWLLHGWTIGDVSFYTTELPEYMLVELVRPFGVGVIHVAAAVTYTLLVLCAFALARGRSRGTEGLVRGLLAAGIMLAPQPGGGAFVLLLSPDHVGTQVPLLLGWLLLDLALSPSGQPAPGARPVPAAASAARRWAVPVALCLLLAWVQVADRVTLLAAVLPLFLVCAVSAIRNRRGPGGAGSAGDEQRAPSARVLAALAGAAVASAGIAWAAARGLAAAGGFTAHPLPFTLAPLRLLWTHTVLTGRGILELYGAAFPGVTGGAGVTFAALHLAGLALALAGTAIALWRFFRSGRADLVDSVLAVAVAANLVGYAASIEPGTAFNVYSAREIAAVLPLGAVLAGRTLGPKLARAARLGDGRHARRGPGRGTRVRSAAVSSVALTLMLGGYAVAFGYAAAQPPAAAPLAVLARWLTAHGLRYGLGGVSANAVTAWSGGRAVVAPADVVRGRVLPLLYQSSVQAYAPEGHDATFLVSSPTGAPGDRFAGNAVRLTFGAPRGVYRVAGYTVDVWTVNLLTKLHR
ncbi:MAG TPA: hypothetical protein VHF26_03730 [Trebonia sp.]|nr:hypothetical protein [Trebonia sp.]